MCRDKRTKRWHVLLNGSGGDQGVSTYSVAGCVAKRAMLAPLLDNQGWQLAMGKIWAPLRPVRLE